VSVEAAVAKLQAQQESMGSDIGDMKAALTSIASSLRDLSAIEQRQINLAESINRAHSRMDEMQAILKEEVKGHEKRIQTIEIAIAKNHWIERVIMAFVMGVIGLWIKGGI
jgi:multidrug resistance efflux pump